MKVTINLVMGWNEEKLPVRFMEIGRAKSYEKAVEKAQRMAEEQGRPLFVFEEGGMNREELVYG